MVGLLGLGELLKKGNVQKTLRLPKSEEVIKYLERANFFRFAGDYFALKPSKPQITEKYLRGFH